MQQKNHVKNQPYYTFHNIRLDVIMPLAFRDDGNTNTIIEIKEHTSFKNADTTIPLLRTLTWTSTAHPLQNLIWLEMYSRQTFASQIE